MILSYRDLEVWQNAMKLVESVYILMRAFPKEELYGLSAQIRRCSVSIPSNIAEGFMRKGTKEFIHFIHIALGSLGELDTQLEIAYRLKYIKSTDLQNHEITTIRKQLYGLLKSLNAKLIK